MYDVVVNTKRHVRVSHLLMSFLLFLCCMLNVYVLCVCAKISEDRASSLPTVLAEYGTLHVLYSRYNVGLNVVTKPALSG